MVKLDVTLLRYLSPEDFRILTSVEMGMRNHELVPGTLINSIASLRYGGTGKILVELTKHKLLAYERGKRFDGYRLTYAGYDYLSLNALTQRDVVGGVGNQIGVGKESDVFICESPDKENQYVIKFHRLGRVCFRKVTEKRDFYMKSKNKTSWIYLSRKAAQREYEFLRYMYLKGMPVPKPIDNNRHVVVMELIDGRILNQFTLESFEAESRDHQVAKLYKELMDLIMRFANETRLVHGDFNEFNILIKNDTSSNGDLTPVIIDLPQMIGVDHELAPEQFERDVNCIVDFFNKRFHYQSDYVPTWNDVKEVTEEEDRIDQYLTQALMNFKDEKYPCEDERDDDETLKPKRDISEEVLSKLEHDTDDQGTEYYDARETCNSPDPIDDSNSEDDLEHKLVDDVDDCLSTFSQMTIEPTEARRRLRAEILRRENNKRRRDAAKPRNIKGEANPVRRRRKTNQYVAYEDAAAFSEVF